ELEYDPLRNREWHLGAGHAVEIEFDARTIGHRFHAMVALVVELGGGKGEDGRAVAGHRIVSGLADVSMILPTADRAVVSGELGKEDVIGPCRVGNPQAGPLFRAGP